MATTDVEIVRYVADVTGLEQGQKQLEQTLLKSKTAASVLERALKDSSESARLYKVRLSELDSELKKNGKLSSESAAEQQRLKSALAQTATTINGQKKALEGLEKQTGLTNSKLKDTKPALEAVGKEANKTGNILQSVGKIFIAFFAFEKIKQFVTAIFDVTAQFQKFEAVLTNTLGSNSLARKALQDIIIFAKETPFGVNEVTGAFVKLANQGFTPTINQLRKLGDLVASTGKTFDQLAEALLDAQQGQFKRLLEFGIRAEKQGDKVSFTFKGVKTVIDNNAESIRNFIVGLGELEGVIGASAAVAETLGGKVEKLGDSFDQFLLRLGDGRLKGLFGNIIEGLSTMLDRATELVTTNAQERQAVIDKFVSAKVGVQDKRDAIEISTLVANGNSKLSAEKDYYSKRLSETTSQYDDLLKKSSDSEKRINALVDYARELSDRGKFTRAKKKSIQEEIDDEESVTKTLKEYLALRLFQKDQYNKNVIDNEKAFNAELNKVDKDAAKKAKKAADEEKKRLQLLETQRRAYNDFNISLIGDQFEREAAQKKEQFFRTIEDSKKNIGEEITTNSEMYKLLSDSLIEDLKSIDKRQKEQEEKAAEERSKRIIDAVNKQISELEKSNKTLEASQLKQLRDQYEEQLRLGVSYSVAKESLDKNIAQKTFESNKKVLNNEIELLSNELVRYDIHTKEYLALKQQLTDKINELDNAEFSERERLRQEEAKKEKEAIQLKQVTYQASQDVITAALDAAIQLRLQSQTESIEIEREKLNSEANGKKQRIDRQVEEGYLSQKQASALKAQVDKDSAKKEQDLKLRQFKADQSASVSRIAIGIATSIINAFATLPYPVALIASAGIAAVGAIQIGVVRSQKPPKFKDGSEIGIKGKGTRTSDQIDAKLSVGETVLSAKETDELRPLLTTYRSSGLQAALLDSNPSSFMPAFNEERARKAQYKNLKQRDKQRKERESNLDLSTLENQTKRNNSIKIKNVDEIGRSVANHTKTVTRYAI